MPRNDWPIIGNSKTIDFFESLLAFERRSPMSIGGTYLVVGPSKIGRTSAIEYFIRQLLGAGSQQTGQTLDMWPDIFRLRRDPAKTQIGVEEARDWAARLALSSFSETYRVGIVHEADTLSHEAANGLLKCLEDAKDRVIIFLIAEQADHLPQTIISRSQKIVFRPVASDEMYEWLVDSHGLERPFAKNIARLANGRPGLALDIMRDQNMLEEYLKPARVFVQSFKAHLYERWQQVQGLLASERGVSTARQAQEIVDRWQAVTRDFLMILLNHPECMRYSFLDEDIRRVSQTLSISEVRNLEMRLQRATNYLRANVNPTLVLENILINL